MGPRYSTLCSQRWAPAIGTRMQVPVRKLEILGQPCRIPRGIAADAPRSVHPTKLPIEWLMFVQAQAATCLSGSWSRNLPTCRTGGVAFSMHPLTFKRGEHFRRVDSNQRPVGRERRGDSGCVDDGGTDGKHHRYLMAGWCFEACQAHSHRTVPACGGAPIGPRRCRVGDGEYLGTVVLLPVRPIVLPRPGTVALDSPESFQV